MQVIGLSDEEQSEIFRMLAIILWLGNVQFDEMEDGNAQVADTSVIDFVAYLMEADAEVVHKVMISKVVETQRGGKRGAFGLSIKSLLFNFLQALFMKFPSTRPKPPLGVTPFPRPSITISLNGLLRASISP